MSLSVGLAIVIGVAAAIEDLVRRRISNWLCLAALVGGFICQFLAAGWPGVGSAALGALAGFGVFLIFYLLGGMGGGDVKLMSGFGALLGPGRLFEAALWTAGIGGLLAILVVAWQFLRARFGGGSSPSTQSIPYAPAIAAGVWLSMVPKG
ncbi:MAG: A24 family peptidase [Acidobacteria bacterium]|nr:A24 family peptidase [Acidobacteriota bacterium]